MVFLLRLCLIASGLAGVWRTYAGYSAMPERVAIHFGAGGRPDSWAGNEPMMIIYISYFTALTLLFLFLPRLLFRLPLKLVNFPGKEFWLDPARRSENFPVVAAWFYTLGILLNILLLTVGELVYSANRSVSGRLDEPLFLKIFVSFVFLIILWLVLLYRRFLRKS